MPPSTPQAGPYPGTGIVGYHAYLPAHRLQRGEVAAAVGSGARGVRCVAGYDEDSTTLAVAAALPVVRGRESAAGSVWFATTDPVYADKTNATAVHAALDLPPGILAADLGATVRSGIVALLAAGRDGGLAVLADGRGGPAGGADEREGADAAAAFLFGGQDPLARVVTTASVTAEFIDRWRAPGAPDGATWEERFGGHGARLEAGDLTDIVGNAGAAQAGLALADLLDSARAGETLLLISLADGADALVLRATDAIAERRGEPLRAQVDRGVTIGYPQYLLWRERIAAERPRRPDPDRPSAPFAWRNRQYKLSMTGGRCRTCGAVQFPLPRVCYQCRTADGFEPVPASGQTARIVTVTVDRLAFSLSPPLVSAIVAFEQGGRLQVELTDVHQPPGVGDEVAPTFRRGATVGGIRNYIWKARPVYPTTLVVPVSAGTERES